MTTIDKIKQEIEAYIRILTIKHFGVHIVSEWQRGGSDARDMKIHTEEKLLEAFPEAPRENVKAFFQGLEEGFIIEERRDSYNSPIRDRLWYPNTDKIGDNIYVETHDEALTINIQKEAVENIIGK